MDVRQLNQAEFKATMTQEMRNVTETATDVLNIWPYVEAIPIAHLSDHSICGEFVESVYRSDDDHFDHVLVATGTKNVYLVVVVDLIEDAILGHRLLDLNQEYGVL